MKKCKYSEKTMKIAVKMGKEIEQFGRSSNLRKDMKISSKMSNCMEIQAKRKKKHDEK